MAIERILGVLAAGLLLASGAALAAQTKAGDPITEKNWLEHPRIKEIRALFNETEQAITAKRMVILMEDEYQQAWGADAEHIRKLGQQRGGEDSAVSLDHYYDQAGILRFAFVRANAVNGTKVEYRIYFDERGMRLWHNYRKTAGPGYTFPEVCPDGWLVFDPYTPVNGD
jgi:hypothetical protein